MTDAGWEAVQLDDLDSIPLFEGVVWHPVRRRARHPRLRRSTPTPAEGVGKHVVEEHDETGGGAGGHEEVYIVISRPRDLHASTARRSTRRPARSSSSATRR